MTETEFDRLNAYRIYLAERFFAETITSEERAELDRLNDAAEAHLAPYNSCFITTLRDLMAKVDLARKETAQGPREDPWAGL